jgi:ubiquinone/menaquinone biosynthesis C-methylase UbiE
MFKDFKSQARCAEEIRPVWSGYPRVPEYLEKTYWWAYVHPRGVRFFDRHALVNLILFGNYRRLCNAALNAFGRRLPGRTLQVACVYGDFTQKVSDRLAEAGSLDVVDVVPIQLANLSRKLPADERIGLMLRDASALGMENGRYDQVLAFFLLHEQPESVRRETLSEIVRVTKAGGRIVLVDYHRPHWLNPLRYFLRPLLGRLEPFALDLWRRELSAWLPRDISPEQVTKRTFFGGLYQQLVIER